MSVALPIHPPINVISPYKAKPAFGFMGSPVVQGVANVVYASEGTRYALEQTLGYTFPRAFQQLGRDEDTVGENNTQAAQESFLRQSLADVTDTFLPGLLATVLIGSTLIDKPTQALTGKPSFVRHNMDLPALHAYELLAKQHPTAQGFYTAVEEALLAHPNQRAETTATPTLNLQQAVQQLAYYEQQQALAGRVNNLGQKLTGQFHHPREAITDRLANQLGLDHLNLSLPLHPTAPKVAIDVPTLLTDLTHLQQANQWGDTLARGLAATQRNKGLQQVGTLAALALSLSVPAGVRLITQWQTGQDAFPGTSRLDDHWRETFKLPKGYDPHLPPAKQPALEASPNKTDKTQQQKGSAPKERFRLFPYLEDSLKRGNPWPTAVGLGFMGTVLGVAVNHHFDIRNGFKPRFGNVKELINTYSYDRHFPYTPVKLMAVTYGLLCGLRMLNARDDSEYRESLVADGLMGWPTLTWCFPLLRGVVGHMASQHLGQQLQHEGILTAEQVAKAPNLLAEHTTEAVGGWAFKEKGDLSPTLLRHRYGINPEQAGQMAKHLLEAHNAITVASGLVSLTLIALIEPKIGIALTSHFTKAKWQKASDAYQQYEASHPTQAGEGSTRKREGGSLKSATLGSTVMKPSGLGASSVSPFVLPTAPAVQARALPVLPLPQVAVARPLVAVNKTPWVIVPVS